MFPGSGTSTPVLELPEDTFSDSDRETADRWSDAYPEWDYSDSEHVGGTREDRRDAAVTTITNTIDEITDPLPWWLGWAVGGLLGIVALGVISYIFGQLFTIEL